MNRNIINIIIDKIYFQKWRNKLYNLHKEMDLKFDHSFNKFTHYINGTMYDIGPDRYNLEYYCPDKIYANEYFIEDNNYNDYQIISNGKLAKNYDEMCEITNKFLNGL